MAISASTLRTLEFARVVAVLEGLAVTPPGRRALAAIEPLTAPGAVLNAQRETTEAVRFLAERVGFPLKAPAELDDILSGLRVDGRALDPSSLLALAEYLESVELCQRVIRTHAGAFPLLERLVGPVSSFASEVADVRRKIEPGGEVADDATPALASIRNRLRTQRAKLRKKQVSILQKPGRH